MFSWTIKSGESTNTALTIKKPVLETIGTRRLELYVDVSTFAFVRCALYQYYESLEIQRLFKADFRNFQIFS